jgi:hypothetical protein
MRGDGEILDWLEVADNDSFKLTEESSKSGFAFH